ncbi:uncharacterized protein LOC23687598 [Aedes aegypti]|uniref:Odorant receptor n=1 Tax=Aedes aegypti TaxID=7159 RepID=A0A6I8U7N1_AEDAE
MRVIIIIIIANAVLLLIPSAATKQALALPPPLSNYGKHVSCIVYLFSTQLLFLGTVPKFLSNMACIGMLIMGMRFKLKILAHRYFRMLNQPVVSSEKHFARMERDVKEVLNYQTEYRKHFETLKMLVEKAFFIAHFYALYSLGTCFYLSHKTGFNVLSLTLISLSVAYILKYYLWCHLVESLQDVANSIGDLIYEHCVQMPYSRKHHTQYMGMKTSLIIIWMNTKNGYAISCMGMIDISTKTFVSFLNAVYSVMMFLINVV